MGTTGQTVPLHWYLLNSRHIESSPAYKRGALKINFLANTSPFSVLLVTPSNILQYFLYSHPNPKQNGVTAFVLDCTKQSF